MYRCKGDMASPRHFMLALFALNYITLSYGGPVGPLPNVTSVDMGIKEGSCALGDVVYMPGDEFPGAGPCERCSCGARGVQCTQLQCEPRPGCKALHRPDHCCPTYQCECEQEGRVYGNGEKLVDPHDPCRVCYCQGGEVVCRRIACFVRDDCTPRLVPGRCCPEYDDCPLRGVTALPGMTPAASASPVEVDEPRVVPSPPKEVKQEITIKEITPVSEIPIITDVKIKEILPSPSIEVAEYSSSKSPLMPREATSEKTIYTEKPKTDIEVPSAVEVHSSPETAPMEEKSRDSQGVDDTPPSKISLSTQDSINSDIYPSNVPIIATMGVPVVPASPASVPTTTKAPVLEEEDTTFLDHNPAFPPLPDDLSVLSNHGDEIVPEPSAETDHILIEHVPTPKVIVTSVTSSTETESIETVSTTIRTQPDTIATSTEKSLNVSTETTTVRFETTSTTEGPMVKESPMLNLRSAIPIEILSAPSEEINAEELSTAASSDYSSTIPATTEVSYGVEIFSTEESPKPKKLEEFSTEQELWASTKIDETSTENVQSDAPRASEEFTTDEPEIPLERVSFIPSSSESIFDTTTDREESSTTGSSSTTQEQSTSSIPKSNVATEGTSQTELSSLPIETSDQNPHDAAENVSKDMLDSSTSESLTTIDKTAPTSAEVITVSKSNENGVIDNVETTEFVMTSFGSSESATELIETIKIAGDSDKKTAAIIDNEGNKNALTDLIKLVSDVASISDHTDAPVTPQPIFTTTISDSEELIPVNAGYKSKNSNFNQNSITEIPLKSKSSTAANKQKIVEIEDEETDGITDAAPPNDKAEPTTRRPIIDNVSDDMPEVKSDKKDIEIITQSYVPTINKRPTKVVLKEEDKSAAMSREDGPRASTAGPASSEVTTEDGALASDVDAPGVPQQQ